MHNGSEGYSVPLIGGHSQAAGRSYVADVLKHERQGNTLLFSLDLSGAYPQEAGLRNFIRSFAWNCDESRGEAELQLTDAFAFTKTVSEVEEVFISMHEPVLGSGSVVWRGGSGEVALSYDADLFELRQEEIESHDHHSSPIVVHRTRLHAKAVPFEALYSFRFICRALS